jgi:lysozyme
MTTPLLLADLRRDEGLRLAAYPDPITHADPWTVGYGHTGAGVRAGLVWTEPQAEAALAADVAAVCRQLDTALPWWRGMDDVRQDALANMAFNLGVRALARFADFLALLEDGSFARAAADLAGTQWAHQVGARAVRIAGLVRDGARPL